METVASSQASKQKASYKPVVEDNIAEPDAYLSLLLTAERRNEKLEQQNTALIAERDDLKKLCDAQQEIIKSLKADHNVVAMPDKNHKPSILLNDIEIDASEFQPVNDVQLLTEREKTLLAVKNSIGKTATTTVTGTCGWLWKKTVALLT